MMRSARGLTFAKPALAKKESSKQAGKKPGEKAKKKLEKKSQKKEPETSPAVSTSAKSSIKPPSTFEDELEVHDKTIRKLAHIEEGYWVITDEVLERIHYDLMVILNMTKSGGVIAFAASETIQPATTVTIIHNLTFTSAPLAEPAGATPDTKQALTSPISGPLPVNE